MFEYPYGEMERINNAIREGAAQRLTDKEFLENEIRRFKASKGRADMITGENYYRGDHDVLQRKRLAIGEGGELKEVRNLPNNRIVDNQYRKMVDQKKNYLLGQPIVLQSENKAYNKHLKKLFGKKFFRTMKNVGEDSLNCGIGWLFINYDQSGELSAKRLRPENVIPGWADADHTQLDYAIHLYKVIYYEGKTEKQVEQVEVFAQEGIYYFTYKGGALHPDIKGRIFEPYFQWFGENEGEGWGLRWHRIPLIAFKFNSKEIPLIKRVKSLQDGINAILSTFQNNMEEDARNTILVIVNYDGEELGEFRRNLATYGAIKVRSENGANGDVRTLQVEVNSENYKAILELFKKAIIENAMGYDAKDDRLGGNANQLNIMSMYSDIDLDANEMETEYQAAFEDLLWFVSAHLANTGQGDYEDEPVEVIFNRDILISETEVIENCRNATGILSTETILENFPWIDDPAKELSRLKKEQQAYQGDDYDKAFGKDVKDGGEAHGEKE